MIVAWSALIIWPILAIIFFQKMRLPAAICTTIIGGYLLLPEVVSYDLPVLPALNKATIPSLTALVLTFVKVAGNPSPFAPTPAPTLKGWLPRDPVILVCLAMLIFGTFGTILTNREPFFANSFAFLPGLRIYDAFSMILSTLILVVAPMLIGRKVLYSPEGQKTLLSILVVWAAFYGFGAFYEARMSPQIHGRIYGFAASPHGFFQSYRNDGWRPLVMLRHGLHLAIFMALATVAAVGLFRLATGPLRPKRAALAGWLLLVLVACKSTGSLELTSLALPIVLLLRPRTQILIAACVSVLVLTYPALRAADLVPVDRIVSYAKSISAERAQSFEFRVKNEDILLEKARQKPIFGWGGFARNRVVDEYGRDISITDGAWVVEFGVGGWVRYIAIFGLLAWPSLALFIYRRQSIDPLSAIVAVVLSVKLLDLLPNAELVPVIWLFAGSLLGRLEAQSDLPMEAAQDAPTKAGYSRRRQTRGTSKTAPKAGYARSFHEVEHTTEETSGSERSRSRGPTPYHRKVPGPGYGK